MDLSTIPLFSMLQNKLGYLSERQRMIAQNVANASTPGFTPADLKPFDQQRGVGAKGSATVLTQAGLSDAAPSIGASGQAPSLSPPGDPKAKAFAAVASPDSETTLNGNQVVLEEEMVKMSESRMDYDAAIGFYQKSLGLLHLAVRKPGG
jgi:flagellar basal-body rod protein FlgB